MRNQPSHSTWSDRLELRVLRKFDDCYFHLYPFLKGQLEPALRAWVKVPEVGIGHRTVAGYLMERDVDYLSLDMTAGPVSITDL